MRADPPDVISPEGEDMGNSDTLHARIQNPIPRPSEPSDSLSALARFSAAGGLTQLADRLMALRQWLFSDLGSIENSINEFIDALREDEPALARKTAAHLLGRPGKRIRPMCVMLGSRIGGGSFDNRVQCAAIAGELVHAATLLHDDVIDDGVQRRGDKTARLVFGNKASILAGDYLLIRSLKLIQGLRDNRITGELLETMASMVDAEALQLSRRGSMDPDRDIYLRIVEGKTASLFCWCFRAGGFLAGMEDEGLEALEEVGIHLGMSFQIVDDILDLDLDNHTTGKSSFSDVREGLITWPLILACEKEPEFSGMLSRFIHHEDSPELRVAMLEKIKGCGALEDTRLLAASYTRQAMEALARLPEGLPREAIEVVLELAVARIL